MSKLTFKGRKTINEKMMIAMVRIGEMIKKESSAIFKSYGLTFSQYDVLRVLEYSDDGQNTITNISRARLVSGPNVTGIVKRLEKKGLITKKNDPHDDRVKLLEITPKGWKTLKELSSVKDKHRKDFLKSYSYEDKILILKSLQQLIKSRS